MRVTMIRETVFIISFLALSLKCFAEDIEYTPVIETSKGSVQGTVWHTVWNKKPFSAFLGIPYGKPPIEDRRFKPPEEVDSWNETLRVVEQPSACPQLDFLLNDLTGNEDCLNLNVYTPETKFEAPLQLLPVMVYIYGGSYSSGYSNYSIYGPDFFLEDDVVVVTFNYRLGALGFLSLGLPEASGNNGLKDQYLALRWVQENIKNFGGDPNAVTLFGQSAGGVAVDFHVLSERSKGLFHRSISQSASTLCPWGFHTPDKAKERAFRLGTLLGYTTTSAENLWKFLLNVPAYDLVLAAQSISLVDPVFKPTLENPTVLPPDQIFMTECSYRKYVTGNFMKQPHMMGHVNLEGLSFAKPVDQVLALVKSTLSGVKGLSNTSPLKELLGIFSEGATDLSVAAGNDIVKTASVLLFNAELDMKQRFLAKHNPSPTYYYNIKYETEYAYHKLVTKITLDGTGHGDDIVYLWHTPGLPVPIDSTHPFNIFRKKIVRLWTNFSKYGNPTPFGKNDTLLNVIWPNSGRHGLQMTIDEECEVTDRQLDAQTRFYENALRAAAPAYTGCLLH